MSVVVPVVLLVLGLGWIVSLVRQRTARSIVRERSGAELHDLTPSNTWLYRQG